RTFTIAVTVGDGADACDGLANVASTDFEDEDADNNTSNTVTNPVTCGPPEPGEPEVEVVKSSDPAPGTGLVPGDRLVYSVSVTETTGEADATDVVVTDTLDAGVSVVSVEGCDSETVAGSTVTCQLDTVAAGSTRTFTIAVTVGDGADACDGLANVASTDFEDEDADNNTSNTVTNPVTCVLGTTVVRGAPTPQAQLATTGTDMGRLPGVAASLLVYGFILLHAARRRSAS
ncbi:MAG TPA: hypothetical protein VHF25_17240, partial [Nitriliruptorales bacterium]|nr:hypothetical protein [Nitriliruptorales bacterium]